MKRNAIVRIIVFSVLVVVLASILINGILEEKYSSITLDGEAQVDVKGIKNLQINWVSGSVEVRSGDGHDITIFENGNNIKHTGAYSICDDTLVIDFNRSHSIVGNAEEKHLIVTVPSYWFCHNLELNGAGLDIRIFNQQIGKLELNGAGCNLAFTGIADTVSANGASVTLSLICENRVSEIDINGASCKLGLTLPRNCGFRVDTNGFGCNFHSDLPGIAQNGTYIYGSQHCKIDINGLGCDVSIFEADFAAGID